MTTCKGCGAEFETWEEAEAHVVEARRRGGVMLTVAESTLLLKRIFPNYPDSLRPANPIPPKYEWSPRPEWRKGAGV